MKKKIVKEITVCDICGQPARTKCELCGRDICENCARYICKKNPAPQYSETWVYFSGGSRYTPEMVICKECFDSLKLSLRISAGQLKKAKEKER